MDRHWAPPPGCEKSENAPQLVLYNSLLDEKVPFVPLAGPHSRQISWYTCGPTVYDSAHMGHARNYVTFDIVRRVLEDYFGYQCTFVMNVTDVDDKIILRARRGFLLKEYKASCGDNAAQAIEDARRAVAAAVAKQSKKVEEAEGQVAGAVTEHASAPSKASEKKVEDLKGQLEQEKLKLTKCQEAAAAVDAIAGSVQGSAGVAQVLAVAGDYVAEALDKERGAAVTDVSIYRAHAARFEAEFLQDMEDLGVRAPDVLTRVSEYVPEIVAYIEKIIANGMAYEANGSVYFDTGAFRAGGHVYGKLNPWAVGSAALASEGEADFETREKRSPQDFALWKAAKPGEPTWPSPWGAGRPGWHIECSAMASAILGKRMDIHSGGQDLRFPHHDNELAQAEAYFHGEMAEELRSSSCCNCGTSAGPALANAQWVNYFLHSGHLGIEGLKMSKSLKNFITIRQALETFTPRQLRLMFLLTPWERSMSYGENAREEMSAREGAIKNFFSNVDVALRSLGPYGGARDAKWQPEEHELHEAILTCERRVHVALLDSVNTRTAMDAIADLIRAVNVYLAKRDEARGMPAPQALLLRRASGYVTRILTVFGLVAPPSDRPGWGAGSDENGAAAAAGAAKYLDAFVAFRDQIRSLARGKAEPKDILAACDVVRDETCVDLGVRLEDKPTGPAIWKLDEPSVLRAEQEARRRDAAQARVKKLANQVALKQKDLEKFEKLAALPSVVESLAGKYRFDAAGNPSHDKEGSALDDKGVKKAMKDVEKEEKMRAPLAKKLEEEGPEFLTKLAAEVQALQAELAAVEAEATM